MRYVSRSEGRELNGAMRIIPAKRVSVESDEATLIPDCVPPLPLLLLLLDRPVEWELALAIDGILGRFGSEGLAKYKPTALATAVPRLWPRITMREAGIPMSVRM